MSMISLHGLIKKYDFVESGHPYAIFWQKSYKNNCGSGATILLFLQDDQESVRISVSDSEGLDDYTFDCVELFGSKNYNKIEVFINLLINYSRHDKH